MNKNLLLSIAALVCGTTQQASANEGTTLSVKRHNGGFSSCQYSVKFNGEQVAMLNSGEIAAKSVAPGTYTVTATMGAAAGQPECFSHVLTETVRVTGKPVKFLLYRTGGEQIVANRVLELAD